MSTPPEHKDKLTTEEILLLALDKSAWSALLLLVADDRTGGEDGFIERLADLSEGYASASKRIRLVLHLSTENTRDGWFEAERRVRDNAEGLRTLRRVATDLQSIDDKCMESRKITVVNRLLKRLDERESSLVRALVFRPGAATVGQALRRNLLDHYVTPLLEMRDALFTHLVQKLPGASQKTEVMGCRPSGTKGLWPCDFVTELAAFLDTPVIEPEKAPPWVDAALLQLTSGGTAPPPEAEPPPHQPEPTPAETPAPPEPPVERGAPKPEAQPSPTPTPAAAAPKPWPLPSLAAPPRKQCDREIPAPAPAPPPAPAVPAPAAPRPPLATDGSAPMVALPSNFPELVADVRQTLEQPHTRDFLRLLAAPAGVIDQALQGAHALHDESKGALSRARSLAEGPSGYLDAWEMADGTLSARRAMLESLRGQAQRLLSLEQGSLDREIQAALTRDWTDHTRRAWDAWFPRLSNPCFDGGASSAAEARRALANGFLRPLVILAQLLYEALPVEAERWVPPALAEAEARQVSLDRTRTAVEALAADLGFQYEHIPLYQALVSDYHLRVGEAPIEVVEEEKILFDVPRPDLDPLLVCRVPKPLLLGKDNTTLRGHLLTFPETGKPRTSTLK